MSKQSFSGRLNQERRQRLASDSSYRSPASRHPGKRSSIEGSESSGAVSQFSTDELSRSEDEELLEYCGEYVDPEEELQAAEYEYMDVRGAGKARMDPAGPLKFAFSNPGARAELTPTAERAWSENDGEDEYVEEDYEYMNRQPKLKGKLTKRAGQDLRRSRGAKGEAVEYEEMECLNVGVTAGAGEPVEYQNIQSEEDEDEGGATPRAGENPEALRLATVGPFVKVRAGVGVGEQGGDQSFDNPDYWHSRLYNKASAVRT